jgi:predicted glycosyltransferase
MARGELVVVPVNDPVPHMAPRIALYSHDALGMGHMRRNLAIARALVAGGRGQALLLTGSHVAGALPLPHGVEVLTLPALRKDADGGYASRSLDLPLEGLLALRAQTIRAALVAFAPDVLIADKHPYGIGRELEPAIRALRPAGTKVVLGLREVLDDPSVVRREWVEDGIAEAIERDVDEVWVYGDRAVYDPVEAYGLPAAVAARARFTGYLAQRGLAGVPEGLPDGRLVACCVGGGQDGVALADAFARSPMPEGTTGVLVTGPFMPAAARQALHDRAARRDDLVVLDFCDDVPGLLHRAEAVVAMGGYNTVCELLAARVPALVVPRVRPRREQLIRARRLAACGLVAWAHPDDLTPERLGRWLAEDHPPPPDPRAHADLGGLDALPRLLDELLARREVVARAA